MDTDRTRIEFREKAGERLISREGKGLTSRFSLARLTPFIQSFKQVLYGCVHACVCGGVCVDVCTTWGDVVGAHVRVWV